MNLSNENREQARDISSLFQEIKEDLTNYINNRLAYHRLAFLEKVSQVSSLLAIGLIGIFLGFSAFSFGLMALGFYLGEVLQSNAAGFGIVALFWLVLLILILIFYKPLKEFFLNRTVRILTNLDEEVEKDEQE